jgi:hypothetical protein
MHAPRLALRRLLALGVVALAAAALVAPNVGATTHRSAHPQDSTAALPYENPALPVADRVQDLLSRMTLAEKIGQMTQAERASIDTDTSKITTDNLGSVLSGGGSVPTPNTPTAWADMVDRYQTAALATPLLYGIDTVHGDGNMYGATVFPHNIGLGASRDPSAIVASWLPGSEGAGVADDLFGVRPFTGKLPVSWPRTLAQEPINVGDPHYNPLYPFGYGLTTHAGQRGGRARRA